MEVGYLPQDQPDQGRRWTFGDCEFIEISRELLVRGTPVKLESKPLEVLLYLLEHPAQVLTKDELIGAAWATSTTDQSLTTAISKLRKAFGGARDSVIRSASGIGYRMAVPVLCDAVDELPSPLLRLKVGDGIPGRPNWRVVKSLSAGGPHSVYLAEHAKTREARVFKFALDGVRLRALQREVTLSRLLNHALGEDARFVRILDWGFEHEPFFIESDYAGMNLFEWSETKEFANLSLAERVALVADIAEAVASAHGLGVLHNDLKPANVLVQQYPESVSDNSRKMPPPGKLWQVKVADFGVASVSDLQRLVDLQITHYGSFQEAENGHGTTPGGTAMYRAPELLAGSPPSIQGDVYALGVILYQTVCGDFLEAPSIGWEARINDAVLRDDIAAAANIDSQSRLSSASELSHRLRTLELRRTEIEERENVALIAERARRQMERARVRRPWLIVAMLALTLGFSASLWFGIAAQRARKAAELDAARARLIEKFTQDLFTGGDDRAPAKDATAEDLLDRGVKQVRGFDSDPSEQADLLETLGGVYDAMGNFERANQLLLDAMNERQRISGSDNPAFARILLAISSLRDEQGQGQEALNLAQRAYEIDVHALPVDDPQTLRAQLAMGSALTTLGQYTKAAPLLETVVQKDRGRPDQLTDLSEATGNLAIAAFYLGDLQQALSLDLEGLAIDRRRVGDKHPDVGSGLITLSQLEAQLGDYAKAEDYGREALAVYQGWFRPGHFEIAGAETTLSDAFVYEGRTPEALPLLQDALRIQRSDFPTANEKTAHTLATLGRAEYALHHLPRALAYYKEAAAQFGSLIPDKDYRFASMLYNEAKVYQDQGDFIRADQALRKALSIDLTHLPALDKRLLDTRLLLGEVLLKEQQPAAAQPLLQQTLRDASTAGASCQQERDVAAKDLQSLASVHAIPVHNP